MERLGQMSAINRYSRNLRLEGFDETSQAALRNATVSIVGAGALGSVVAMYLAGSGVGNIRIADFDNIDISNLQRQVFYTESEAGCPKAEAHSAWLCRIEVVAVCNPFFRRQFHRGRVALYPFTAHRHHSKG